MLELWDAQFMESTGVQLRMMNLKDATHKGWQLRMDVHVRSEVRQVVELVGLAYIFWG